MGRISDFINRVFGRKNVKRIPESTVPENIVPEYREKIENRFAGEKIQPQGPISHVQDMKPIDVEEAKRILIEAFNRDEKKIYGFNQDNKYYSCRIGRNDQFKDFVISVSETKDGKEEFSFYSGNQHSTYSKDGDIESYKEYVNDEENGTKTANSVMLYKGRMVSSIGEHEFGDSILGHDRHTKSSYERYTSTVTSNKLIQTNDGKVISNAHYVSQFDAGNLSRGNNYIENEGFFTEQTYNRSGQVMTSRLTEYYKDPDTHPALIKLITGEGKEKYWSQGSDGRTYVDLEGNEIDIDQIMEEYKREGFKNVENNRRTQMYKGSQDEKNYKAYADPKYPPIPKYINSAINVVNSLEKAAQKDKSE